MVCAKFIFIYFQFFGLSFPWKSRLPQETHNNKLQCTSKYWCTLHIDPYKGRLLKRWLKMLGVSRKNCIKTSYYKWKVIHPLYVPVGLNIIISVLLKINQVFHKSWIGLQQGCKHLSQVRILWATLSYCSCLGINTILRVTTKAFWSSVLGNSETKTLWEVSNDVYCSRLTKSILVHFNTRF